LNHIATGRTLSPGENYSLLIIGDSNVVEMAVKSMETVVEATASMEMALGALPHPVRVPKQRLLYPEIALRRRQHCRTILGKTPIVLGFSIGRLYIGEEAASEVDQGHHTIGPRGPGGVPP
jgi:hypothetical protein